MEHFLADSETVADAQQNQESAAFRRQWATWS